MRRCAWRAVRTRSRGRGKRTCARCALSSLSSASVLATREGDERRWRPCRDALEQTRSTNGTTIANEGQFTQQDPMGVAGGASVHGFAGGDPVNCADPFGLRECPAGWDRVAPSDSASRPVCQTEGMRRR